MSRLHADSFEVNKVVVLVYDLVFASSDTDVNTSLPQTYQSFCAHINSKGISVDMLIKRSKTKFVVYL